MVATVVRMHSINKFQYKEDRIIKLYYIIMKTIKCLLTKFRKTCVGATMSEM